MIFQESLNKTIRVWICDIKRFKKMWMKYFTYMNLLRDLSDFSEGQYNYV